MQFSSEAIFLAGVIAGIILTLKLFGGGGGGGGGAQLVRYRIAC